MDEIQNLQQKLNAAEEALITAQDEHARAEESRIAAEVILPSLLSGCMGILTYCVPFYIFSAITVIDQVFWDITAQWTRSWFRWPWGQHRTFGSRPTVQM